MTIDELKEKMETGEEFELEDSILTYKYDKKKELFVHVYGDSWEEATINLNGLLKTKLIHKPWKPKVGYPYWYWFSNSYNIFICGDKRFENSLYDMLNIAFGNCFQTKEECESHTEVRDKWIEMRKEYTE